MNPRRSAFVALLCGVLALTACTAEDDAAGASRPPATPGPVSEFTVACPTWSDPEADPGKDRLPDLRLECLGSEGLPVDLSGQLERPVLVNVWASWCHPCRAEMPLLVEVAGTAGDKLDLLGVASLDARASATSVAVELGLNFPSVLDPKGQVAGKLGIQGMPFSLLIDVDGTIAYRHVGPFKSVEQVKELVAEHLKVTL